MNLHDYPDTDSPDIELNAKPVAESLELDCALHPPFRALKKCLLVISS